MGKEEDTPKGEIRIVGDLHAEDVTSGDYARALEGLQRYLGVDISEIETLEDTSAKASTIGRDLQRVLLAQGEFDQWDHSNREADGSSTTFIERSYILKNQVGNDEVKLTTFRAGTMISLKVSDLNLGRSGEKFSVALPVGHDIDYVDSEREWIRAYAFRVEEYNKVYIPVDNPGDRDVQQAFARTLQEGIGILLLTLPQPTVVPFSLE